MHNRLRFDPDKHHRRSVRLKGYDYTQEGAYFVTICTVLREPLFGNIENGAMFLSPFGEIALAEWLQTAHNRPYVELDAFVVMPNHVHGIIAIIDDSPSVPVGAQRAAPLLPHHPPSPQNPAGVTPNNVKSGSLGAIVRAYKSAVSRRVNLLRDTTSAPVWQRSFHDHIIRTESALNAVREYILDNPARWAEDEFYG